MEEENQNRGTHIMGAPAVPAAHPNNIIAIAWNAGDHQEISQQPSVVNAPIDNPNNNPLVPVVDMFNTWTRKAETMARDIWDNGHLVSEVAFETLFRQTFQTDPNERLQKTFACYLSTTTGPVAGTLYLSTARVAFCSDRPLSFAAPSGQECWCYYKVMRPLGNLRSLNPTTLNLENPAEKYIQIVTNDNHNFCFMGFFNFDEAKDHLWNSFPRIGNAI